MPDTKKIYHSFSGRYHALVAREDYEHNLLPAILAVDPLTNKEILELGAGTGRITSLVTPRAQRLVATDSSFHMLTFGKSNLSTLALNNWHLTLATHLALPFVNHSADLVIAGWSFCYSAIDAGKNWQSSLARALREVKRVLRPGHRLIIIESLGTGFETPNRPEVLGPYLDYLDTHRFESTWVRTDYCFKDRREALDLTTFFFGDAPLPMWETEKGVVVPECTGLWWKTF